MGIDAIIDVIRSPWKRLREKRGAALPGFRRYIYVSVRKRLVVVTEEDDNIVIVTSWSTSRDIRRLVESRVRRGVWVEE